MRTEYDFSDARKNPYKNLSNTDEYTESQTETVDTENAEVRTQ